MSSRNIQKIARSEAVEDASSSEQLDQRMVVITSSSWLLLVILVAALALAILWGFLGRIPASISGEGLLIDGNLPVSVKSSKANGSVIEMVARVGSLVERDQQIVTVDNRDLAEQIANAESFLSVLERQNAVMTAQEEVVVERQKTSTANQVALANETIEETRRLVKMYESEVGDLEALVGKKLISSTELVQGRASLFNAMQQVSQQGSIIAQAEVSLESSISTIEQSRLSREQQITQARNSLSQLRIQGEQASSIKAPV